MKPNSALNFYYFCSNMKMHLSEELTTVFSYSKEEAIRTGSYEIHTAHFLLGLLRHASNDSCAVLRKSGIELADLKSYLDSVMRRKETISYREDLHVVLSSEAESCFNLTILEAVLDGSGEATPLHLLLAISKTACPVCKEYFALKDITYGKLASIIREMHPATASVSSPAPDDAETDDKLAGRMLGIIETIKRENNIFS